MSGHTQEMIFTRLRNVAAAMLVLAFLAAIVLPVYTDEVGWRFQERAGIDGVDKFYTEHCGLVSLATPPLFMMPIRYFSGYMNLWFADPLYVRLSGIFYAILFIALLLVLIHRVCHDRREQAIVGIVAVGLLSLANLPLLLVWSRPEQPLLLATMGALLLACPQSRSGTPPADSTSAGAWCRSLAIVVLAMIALSYHFKAMVLMPLLLICLFYASRGRAAVVPRLVCAGLIAIFGGLALSYWVGRMQCPDDAVLRMTYARHNFGANLSHVDGLPGLFGLIGKMLGNVSFSHYVELAAPSVTPMSLWLPKDQLTLGAAGLWKGFVKTMWLGAAIFAVVWTLIAGLSAFRRRRIDRRLVLSAAIFGLLMGWSATQVVRNVYEASFFLPLLTIAIVFALSAARPGPRLRVARNVFAVVLGVSAISSILLIAHLWAPSLLRSDAEGPYIAEQPFSVPVLGFSRSGPEILAAGRLCGLNDPAKANALLIDDLTYFAVMDSHLPQHRLGVLGKWRDQASDPIEYLRRRKSDGAIIGCQLLPENLRRRAKQHGAFCCLAPSNW
jgi:hypothetical protein